MDLHGASLSVTSDGVGRGSCFTIEMPLVTALAQEPSREGVGNRNLPVQIQPSLLQNLLRFFQYVNSILCRSFSCQREHTCLESSKVAPDSRLNDHLVDGSACLRRSSNDSSQNSDSDMNLRGYRGMHVLDEGTPSNFHQCNTSLPSSMNNFCREKGEVALVGVTMSPFRSGSKSSSIAFTISRGTCATSFIQTSSDRTYLRNRVLIVDDVHMNRKMMRRLLSSRFDIVDEAENGQQALDMVRASLAHGEEAWYDIITMDYQMPVMDGVTATRIIRQIGYSGLIIGVTGNVLREDINTFLSSGVNIVLMKPLTIAAFDEYLKSFE